MRKALATFQADGALCAQPTLLNSVTASPRSNRLGFDEMTASIKARSEARQ